MASSGEHAVWRNARNSLVRSFCYESGLVSQLLHGYGVPESLEVGQAASRDPSRKWSRTILRRTPPRMHNAGTSLPT